MLCKLTGDRKLQVYRHPLRRATHRAAELGRRMSEQMMKMTMRDACGPGGTAGTTGPEGVLGLSVTSALLADLSCQVETPLRVFLYSCGTSYLRSQAVLQCTVCR